MMAARCWLLAAVLGVVAQAAPAETVERFDAGFWEGGAQFDSSGKLFDCYLRAQNLKQGYAIFLRWDADGLHLTLMDNRWALETGSAFVGRVRIDRKYDKEVPGAVLASSLVDYRFGFDPNAWQHIGDGSTITLEGPAGRFNFPLTGTGKALGQLSLCADKYFGDADSEAQQVASAPQTSSGDSGQPQDTRNPTPSAASASDPGADIARALQILVQETDGTPEEAFALSDRAAATGDRQARWLSGQMALAGYGTDMPRDLALARILSAAEAGHPEALTFMAVEYLSGDDPVEQAAGRAYLERAAAQAHAPAIAALRLMRDGDAR